MRHYCFNIFLIFVFLFSFLFVFIHSANAALILNRPNYTGLNKGLVGFWSFDGKDIAGFPSTATTPGTVYDKSGQGNNGLYYNATGTQPVEGKLGQALSFDGVDDVATIPNSSSLNLTSSNMTVSAWVKFNSAGGTTRAIVSGGDATGGIESDGYMLVYRSTGDCNSNNSFNFARYDGAWNCASYTINPFLGNWYHVVGVYDGTSVKLFVDGLQQASGAGGGATAAAIDRTAIGKRFSSGNFFDGQIDDVRIYNRALSADEIKRLYRIGGTLHVNSGDLGKNDTLQKGLVGYWSFDGKDIAGFPSTATSPGTVYDRSGQGNNGLYYNATGTRPVSGKIGQALSFDGVDDLVNIGGTPRVGNENALAVSLWFKTTTNIQSLFYMESSTNGFCNPACFYMEINDNGVVGQVESGFLDDASAFAGCNTGVALVLNDGNWHHAVEIQRSKSSRALYIDGVAACVDTGTIGTATLSRTTIGARGDRTGNLNGTIDDVRIYNRALTADEIKRLYRIGGTLHVNSGDLGKNDTLQKGLVGYWTFDGKDIAGFPSTATSPGTVYDRSGQGNNGLYYNATGTRPISGKLGQALSFDGVDDQIVFGDAPDFERTDAFSGTAWIKYSPTGGEQTIMAKTDSANNDRGWFFYVETDGLRIALVNGWVGALYASKDSSTNVDDDTWHHVAFTYDGSFKAAGLLLYTDGVAVSAIAGSDSLNDTMLNDVPLKVGRDSSCCFANGTIDDVRIYNRVLTADEIKRLYNLGR